MFAFTALAVLALALGARADVVVSTPDSITECQPANFQISGSSSGPYYAFIVNASDPCGNALDEIDNITGSSFNWTANLPAGTSVMVALESEDGTEGWSGGVTIGAGDSSCLSGSSAPTSTTAATTTTAAVVVAAQTTSVASTHSVNQEVPVNAATEVPSNSTNGAGRAAVGLSSVVALVGAAVAALAL